MYNILWQIIYESLRASDSSYMLDHAARYKSHISMYMYDYPVSIAKCSPKWPKLEINNLSWFINNIWLQHDKSLENELLMSQELSLQIIKFPCKVL